jgi:FlaA1/EpsC-like NDP-sugar epimerase
MALRSREPLRCSSFVGPSSMPSESGSTHVRLEAFTPESTPACRPGRQPWLSHQQLLLLDAILLLGAWAAAWSLRFEGTDWMRSEWRAPAIHHLLLSLPLWIGCMAVFRLYRRVWSEASIDELKAMLVAVGIAAIGNVLLSLFILPLAELAPARLPLSIISSSTMWSIGALMLPRLFARVWRSYRLTQRSARTSMPVLIVGAGAAGRVTAREIAENVTLGMKSVGYLDDDGATHGLSIGGAPVLGPVDALSATITRFGVRQVIVTLGQGKGETMRLIVRTCAEVGVPVKVMPPVGEILSGRLSLSELRPVEIQDLLRRAPVQTDLGAVRRTLGGNSVLVTGAGGSIGSELCRQIARAGPRELLLLGHGENSIFEIQQELRTHFPSVPLRCLIADIRDEARIDHIFARHRPRVVFHAAAHKHVPLMEENLPEAITNNVKGTRVLVDAAVRHDVQRFVLISSDKAVNPSSIMGATKRIAELLVQRAAIASGRQFVSVRFGNVLGSRGSVVPTFLRQIRAGGPITITHPDMQRYFMTIPEAVQLVLQGAVLGTGSEVFVLDMGEPVRIVDLAQDLIRLSGLRVDEDVAIHFTGLRPGEKLFEELSRDDENLQSTTHPSILRARMSAPPVGMVQSVDALVQQALLRADDGMLRQCIAELVPEYIAMGTDHVVAKPELTLVA